MTRDGFAAENRYPKPVHHVYATCDNLREHRETACERTFFETRRRSQSFCNGLKVQERETAVKT